MCVTRIMKTQTEGKNSKTCFVHLQQSSATLRPKCICPSTNVTSTLLTRPPPVMPSHSPPHEAGLRSKLSCSKVIYRMQNKHNRTGCQSSYSGLLTCRYFVNMKGIRCPRCSASLEGPCRQERGELYSETGLEVRRGPFTGAPMQQQGGLERERQWAMRDRMGREHNWMSYCSCC